ncbi:unnamed protein product, partial [Mesorhabditis spiculigera]
MWIELAVIFAAFGLSSASANCACSGNFTAYKPTYSITAAEDPTQILTKDNIKLYRGLLANWTSTNGYITIFQDYGQNAGNSKVDFTFDAHPMKNR